VKVSHAIGTRTVEAAGYIFENGGKNAEARYHQLSRLYDANTIRHIERRGIDRGWSCLEVGGGGGSVASWLCLRVGVTGRVLATDIDTRFLRTLSYPNLGVRRHDICCEGLPKQEFDLGVLFAAASFFLWTRRELFGDLGGADENSEKAIAYILLVLRPVSVWILATGLMMARLAHRWRTVRAF